jgi:hypothetical protein
MDSGQALDFVREHGVVLVSASGPVPKLTEAIAGECLGQLRRRAAGRHQHHAMAADEIERLAAVHQSIAWVRSSSCW